MIAIDGSSLWLLLGAFFVAAAVAGFLIGRFLAVPIPAVILAVWAIRHPRNPGDDVPSLAALILYSAQLGVFAGWLLRKFARLARAN